MTKQQPNDESVQLLVGSFCRSVHRLKSLHYTFNALFARGKDKTLLEQAAPLFFSDLNQILIDYILLEFAKLTDPARSKRGQYENLTVDYLLTSIEWTPECMSSIREAKKTISKLREYIKTARDNVLAHRNVDAALSGESYGAFPEGMEVNVIRALEFMANELHRASTGKVYGVMAPGNIGDAHELKSILIDGIAFRKLLSATRDENLDRLYAIREEVMGIRE